MAKKPKEITPSTATETVALDSAGPGAETSLERPDPMLLGVSVPLNLTISATKQIVDAWKECFVALSAAIKARTGEKAAITSTSGETAPVITA